MPSIFSDPTIDHALWIYVTALVASILQALLSLAGDALPSAKTWILVVTLPAVPALAAYGAARGWSQPTSGGAPSTAAGPPARPT